MQKRFRILAVAILFGLLGYLGGSISTEINAQPSVQLTVADSPPPLTEEGETFANVYQQVSPSVVSINVFSSSGAGSGSGFVIDEQGHILTNNHVVFGASEIVVNFIDGTITRAEVVGLDPDSDLAVIQVDIPQERLLPVTFGDSTALTVGQTVLAVGSPFGQEWTLTSGIISALNRTIDSLGAYRIGAAIQTDAAINPGNSGGPLLNLAGQVVGVNSQIISRSNASAGVGFAVPSNLALRVATALIETGEVAYSFIGISGSDVSLEAMETLNLPDNQQGVVVGEANSSGPAGSSGVRAGDVITAINGIPVTGFDTLIAYLAQNTQPGTTVTLTVLRNGETVDIPVTLGQRPATR